MCLICMRLFNKIKLMKYIAFIDSLITVLICETDIGLLEDFQKYASRRIQRLYNRAPNMMNYVTLGWIRLENFINVKKLLFTRTLMVQQNGNIHKEVFRLRLNQFIENPRRCIENVHNSPISDMLKIACICDVLNDIVKMTKETHYFSKEMWSRKIWERAWSVEDFDWNIRTRYFEITKMYKEIESGPQYSIWWKLADKFPRIIRQCETMIKLICGASRLKEDDQHCKSKGIMCSHCKKYAKEDACHVIMQCSDTEHLRREMANSINERIGNVYYTNISMRGDYFNILLGKICDEFPAEVMTTFWATTCIYVSKMYWSAINNRIGIG